MALRADQGARGSEVARLLVVSEQDRWADQLVRGLVSEGFGVVHDRTGDRLLEPDERGGIDVVIVDLRMRLRSGLALCAGVRARSSVPVLAVGSDTDESGVLAAYAAGVDQFVADDASPRLVVARVRALLRRVPSSAPAPVTPPAGEVPVTVDETTGTVLLGGVVVRLSRREMQVLRVLVARPGRVVTRAELTGAWPALSSDRRLDFVIRRLRQKLESVDGTRRINAVRGVGFRFELEDPSPG